jgi:hypothetical protein
MNTIGTSVSSPAAIGETVETNFWSVKCRDALRGVGVVELYPSEDLRVRRFAEVVPDTVPNWVAFQVIVKNVSAREWYFPPTAFAPVTDDGVPILDFLTLTPPNPDVARTYAAGESHEGWVMFQPPDEMELGDIFRFLPFRTDTDPRYLTLGGMTGDSSETPTSAFVLGDEVVLTEDQVNLRTSPATSAEIVAVLPIGSVLKVTGAPATGDGHTWYPVEVIESGATGYVAAEFLAFLGS